VAAREQHERKRLTTAIVAVAGLLISTWDIALFENDDINRCIEYKL